MVRSAKILLGAVGLVLMPIMSFAQSVGDTIVSNGISSLGLNFEAAYQATPNYRFRAVLMTFPEVDELSDTFDNGGTTFSYDANVGGFAGFVDYYPTGARWRISGGLVLNRTEIDGRAKLSAENVFILDDGTAFDTGEAQIVTEFAQQISPVVTAGYDYWYDENWVLSAEVGAIYTGGLTLEASSTNTALQAEINDDADVQQARDDGRETKYFPYIAFTIGYRF